MRRIFHQKWWVIVLEVVGVVLLLFVGLVIAVAVTSPPLPQTKATATQVPTTAPTRVPTPTQVPTVAPTAVPTKAPQVVPTPTVAPSQGAAVLGALLGPFVAKFGQPNSCSNPPMYNLKQSACGNGPAAGVTILVMDDSYGHNRVQSIDDDAPVNTGWDVNTARAVCLSFLPPDAQYQKRIDEATAYGTGFILRYYSATIAQEFTPDQFSDGNGNTTPRGVFEVAFVDGNGSPVPTSQIDTCNIAIGEQGWQNF